MEDIRAAQLPQGPSHGALDRAGLRIDYKFALRRHLDSAASYSGIKTPSTPSFQVSALENSSSLLISGYYTAHTSQNNVESRRPSAQTSTGESRPASRKCTQILVRNVGSYQTMAFQVAPQYTIEKIKSLVRERIGLENAKFELLYSGSVLCSSDKSIEGYGIPHDATLSCISFRPTTFPLALVITMSFTYTTFRLSVKPNSLVRQIKEMCADRLGTPRPEDLRLVHEGKPLGDDGCLSNYGVGNESILYLVQGLGVADTGAEKVLLESPKPQGEDLAPPRSSKAKTPAKQGLSFWKAPFGAPWVPTRRVYYGMHRVG